MVDVGRRGRARQPGHRPDHSRQPFRPDGGDLDLDASIEALAEAQGDCGARPTRSGCGSGAGASRATACACWWTAAGRWAAGPLATSAVAAAAVALRAPADYSVLAFGPDVVVAKAQDAPKPCGPGGHRRAGPARASARRTWWAPCGWPAGSSSAPRRTAGRRPAVGLSGDGAGRRRRRGRRPRRAVHRRPGLRRRGGPGAGRVGRRPPGHRRRPEPGP